MASNSNDKPVLHTYFRSSCSWRVRIALHHKQIDYTPSYVNLLKGEQKGDKYAATNPGKLLPALEIDGNVLTQSVAILEYLEETRPQHPLLPSDAAGRAHVRALVNAIACDIQPLGNLRVQQYHSTEAEQKLAWGRHWTTLGFVGVEAAIAKRGGKYCYGDNVTLADVCLVPQVYNAGRFGVDMTQFPNIVRVVENLKKLDAFVQSAPEAQADCPPAIAAAAAATK
ncbi:Glutathione S-transferase zeta-1 [Allomyces arbusculus]|nr:Glutathione S-transferase zeta-1 [Allomyces arbusculus]